jgi:hypothetical protein
LYRFAVQDASLSFEGPDGAEVVEPTMAPDGPQGPLTPAAGHALHPGHHFGEFDFWLAITLDGPQRLRAPRIEEAAPPTVSKPGEPRMRRAGP